MSSSMRVRINRQEAQFLVETLQTRKEEIEALIERKKQLDTEIYQLRQKLFYDPMVVLREGLTEKREELKQLEAQSYRMFQYVTVFDSLIAKLSHVASGTKRRGRYSTRETFHAHVLPKLLVAEIAQKT